MNKLEQFLDQYGYRIALACFGLVFFLFLFQDCSCSVSVNFSSTTNILDKPLVP